MNQNGVPPPLHGCTLALWSIMFETILRHVGTIRATMDDRKSTHCNMTGRLMSSGWCSVCAEEWGRELGQPRAYEQWLGAGSANRSVQPSMTNLGYLSLLQSINEDYDEDVAEALVTRALYRGGPFGLRRFVYLIPISVILTRLPPPPRCRRTYKCYNRESHAQSPVPAFQHKAFAKLCRYHRFQVLAGG